ncbi:MAG TPA: hypothetical protein VMW16_03340 [Sedimentisphaerales bacterium]|nr:hypothetical protein [Sedimentisphaerales bacterium]
MTLVSILKKIVQRFNVKAQDAPSEKVFVAAFGKHPGWDDHIEDIGFETDILVAVKRMIYVQGIGANIDSGSWDKLQQNQLIEGFKHVFVWCMEKNVVVGRMWSSRDGKGRSSYPMAACVQCCQLPLRWVLENIVPRLEKIEEACVSTTSPDKVRMTIENARNELRQLAQECQSPPDSPVVYPDALSRLADNPEMGPNREGLLRILYHIEREVGRYRLNSDKTRELRPTLLRVPVLSSASQESMLLWISFLLAELGRSTPLLVLMPLSESWMDIIIGEPTESRLYCLRANVAVIPLTSSIPYNMDAEFIERADKLIADSGSDKTK